MKVLVVGSGGREHALCWSIVKSPLCSKLYCAPGNPGIASVAECLPIAVDRIQDLVETCRQKAIDFVVIGPELPLTLGLGDNLRAAGIACFGPGKLAAEIEGSKGFMKDLCMKAHVPTAAYQCFTDAEAAKTYVQTQGVPLVIKADGLAAGKGVTVAHTLDEALKAIDDAMIKNIFGAAGTSVVIEEFMEGEEVSFFALCDGVTAIPFTAAQDHKAVYDGDKGPNTGGMGAYSPAPIVNEVMQKRIMHEIIDPTVEGMRAMGRPFTGVLFAGLMMTKTGPRLIEFNARFGDPETEAMLMRLKSDLLTVLIAASEGKLSDLALEWHDQAALCVIMAAKGYPGHYQKNTVIRGFERAASIPNTVVFHAGTQISNTGDITSQGGRVLAITGTGSSIHEAQKAAYQAIAQIDWPEGFCRRDIGWRAIEREKIA